MYPVSPSPTNHSWWVMHTSGALPWVVFVPLGAVTRVSAKAASPSSTLP